MFNAFLICPHNSEMHWGCVTIEHHSFRLRCKFSAFSDTLELGYLHGSLGGIYIVHGWYLPVFDDHDITGTRGRTCTPSICMYRRRLSSRDSGIARTAPKYPYGAPRIRNKRGRIPHPYASDHHRSVFAAHFITLSSASLLVWMKA